MKYLFPVLLITFLFGCTKIEDEQHIIVENDSSLLSSRITYGSDTVNIDESIVSGKVRSRAVGGKASELLLTLVAEVLPPQHNGTTLQATEVRISGNKAYVSYNVKDSTFLGAVDIFDISTPTAPTLISNAIFTDRDINGLSISGNDLYLAAASSDETYQSPAILDVIRLSGGLLTDSRKTVDIASYASTDVDSIGSYIYVTSGADNGKVSVLDKSTLALISELDIDDARGVDVSSNDIGVVAGTNARLLTFDKDLGTMSGDYNLNGATIAASKSTVEVKHGVAYLGLGDGGMQAVCMANGAVINHITQPVVTGLDSTLTVTNAVTAYKRSVFMANGEAGVYVAIADSNLPSNSCVIDNLQPIGKLILGAQESVNHVTYRSDILFVAAGLGGLKIIKVNDSKALADSDDAL